MGRDIWNPWHGCHKISEGCRNCYMYCMDAMRGRPEWSPEPFRTGKFNLPTRKGRDGAYKIAPGLRIRVNMTSDTFIDEARDWMPDFWGQIRKRPDVLFWLLTKRPGNILPFLPPDWGSGWENVVLSVTAENQEAFNARWPVFAQVPAKHKELCCAPLIGPVDLSPALAAGQLDCVLAGGENYDNPRICRLSWVQAISAQCDAHRVNFCWYESGTRFDDGRRVRAWPRKADQGAIAYLSGLNRKFRDIRYVLKSPVDGHVLPPDELHSPVYNLNHCTFCANRMLCSGCLLCGDCCAPPVLGTLQEVWDTEDRILAVSPPEVYAAYCKNI